MESKAGIFFVLVNFPNSNSKMLYKSSGYNPSSVAVVNTHSTYALRNKCLAKLCLSTSYNLKNMSFL